MGCARSGASPTTSSGHSSAAWFLNFPRCPATLALQAIFSYFGRLCSATVSLSLSLFLSLSPSLSCLSGMLLEFETVDGRSRQLEWKTKPLGLAFNGKSPVVMEVHEEALHMNVQVGDKLTRYGLDGALLADCLFRCCVNGLDGKLSVTSQHQQARHRRTKDKNMLLPVEGKPFDEVLKDIHSHMADCPTAVRALAQVFSKPTRYNSSTCRRAPCQ